MPSSIDRSAPADSASLPEVMTTPLTAASAEVCCTIASSSLTEVSSSTFMERPGVSHVTNTMPSASVSSLKFLKAICRSLDDRRVGYRSVTHHCCQRRDVGGLRLRLTHPTALNSFDDRRSAHAASDA